MTEQEVKQMRPGALVVRDLLSYRRCYIILDIKDQREEEFPISFFVLCIDGRHYYDRANETHFLEYCCARHQQ